VKAIAVASLAARMAFAADGLAGQRLERPLLLRSHPLVVVAVRARFRLFQTAILKVLKFKFKFNSIKIKVK
jgi:hypothetical protein